MTTKAINIIFDGPPSNNPGRFVKVETDDGHCINAGEWIEREDGLWALRITALPEDDNVTSVDAPTVREVERTSIAHGDSQTGPRNVM